MKRQSFARRGAIAAITALTFVGAAALAQQDAASRAASNGFDIANSSLPAQAIQRGGPPKDGIPAIDDPKFVPAGRSGLDADDRVLGLLLNGVARAYPIRILNWHEVVNDRFADRAVVVSYCPLCGTGMAFEAPVRPGGTGFGVSGLLYNSDVLLYDRATESLWSQILGTAISGPLQGTRLQPIALTHTSWSDWRARHPDTQVLSTETGFARDYGRDPYAGYDRMQRLLFDVQHRDDRFPLKEWVLGIEIDGTHKAYPFSVLARRVDARGELTDKVGNRTLRIRYDAHHGSAEAFDAAGLKLPATMAFWFAWVAFHPQTEVLRNP
ncbi:MAG: DUF3179 domain-containing protein [Burkholderiaceae bacterium]